MNMNKYICCDEFRVVLFYVKLAECDVLENVDIQVGTRIMRLFTFPPFSFVCSVVSVFVKAYVIFWFAFK